MAATWIGTCSNEGDPGHLGGVAACSRNSRPLRPRLPQRLRRLTQPAPAATTTSDAPSPVPSTEPVLTGWIDLGYRWQTGVGGSLDTYRSIINLGSGPKFLGTDLHADRSQTPLVRYDSSASRLAGAMSRRRSVHVEAKKSGVYDFNADYRDFAYFNFLPSYADPLLGQGIVLDEQSFDTRRKIAALSLDIRPGHWWSPYFGWDHDSSSGTGATVFVTDGNNYPVPNTLRDSTDLYRARRQIRKASFSRHARRRRHGLQERSEPVSESGFCKLRQFLRADLRPDPGSDQPAGRLRNRRIQRLQQSLADGESHQLAGHLRPVPLQPAEQQRPLSADRRRQSLSAEPDSVLFERTAIDRRRGRAAAHHGQPGRRDPAVQARADRRILAHRPAA